jgi:alpha-galactosidase
MTTGVEGDSDTKSQIGTKGEGIVVRVKGEHQVLTQVDLLDDTDRFNQLVFEKEWLLHPKDAEGLVLKGNLFVVEETHSQKGVVFVKRAPLPHARDYLVGEADMTVKALPGSEGYEFMLHLTGPEELESWEVLRYENGEHGRRSALHTWQQSLRPSSVEHLEPRFISNTWGDRNRDACINHDFILKEIESGARLGVDVIQIDDGWQKGRTANSSEAKEKGGVWIGFWAADPDFWVPDPVRFPKGLEPLVKKAEEKGMQIGLWYAPDSHEEFSNWKRDADQIIKLHNRYRVSHFKLDSILTETILARKNLRSMMEAIGRESRGRVVCDLDITAGVRPGYFAEMTLGPLFLENRYTDWHNYWPHFTLRNLWQLSQYVDPRRLRMEFLNNTRNIEKYKGDHLAPKYYSPATLFAITMFSNPLGWFECSGLTDSFIEDVARIVRVWKEHRSELFGGTIRPVGLAPNGHHWTGFLSLGKGGGTGYLLVFNEKASAPSYEFDLSETFDSVEVLSGEGAGRVSGNSVVVELDQSFGYLFMRLSKS